MNKTILRNYAKLIVKMGVNVQKGQDVIINASVDDNYFVKYVVEECYKAKARKVTVDWSSDDVTRLHYKYQKAKTLGEVTDWRKAKLQYEVETLPARNIKKMKFFHSFIFSFFPNLSPHRVVHALHQQLITFQVRALLHALTPSAARGTFVGVAWRRHMEYMAHTVHDGAEPQANAPLVLYHARVVGHVECLHQVDAGAFPVQSLLFLVFIHDALYLLGQQHLGFASLAGLFAGQHAVHGVLHGSVHCFF